MQNLLVRHAGNPYLRGPQRDLRNYEESREQQPLSEPRCAHFVRQ